MMKIRFNDGTIHEVKHPYGWNISLENGVFIARKNQMTVKLDSNTNEMSISGQFVRRLPLGPLNGVLRLGDDWAEYQDGEYLQFLEEHSINVVRNRNPNKLTYVCKVGGPYAYNLETDGDVEVLNQEEVIDPITMKKEYDRCEIVVTNAKWVIETKSIGDDKWCTLYTRQALKAIDFQTKSVV